MTRPLPRYRAQRGRLLPFLMDALDPRTLMVATNASVDFAVTHQTIEGTGAAMISWVGQDVLPEYGQASFYDQLVNDLGASAVRGPVWPNFEVANDNNDPNVFDWTKFDSSQIQNVMTFFQRMKERGVKTFLLTVWTPPYWQKTNLSLQSGGQLRPDMRDEFAEYLAAVVIAAKRDFDIDVSAVSVQNEQFFNEWYESALLDNLNLRETVLAVQKKFKYEGLTTKILANEDVNGSNAHRWLWYNDPLLNDPQIDRSNLIIGSHTGPREGMPAQRDQLAGTGIPIWYSEVSGRPLGWWDALMTGADASDAFTQADATAYFYWQFSDTAPNATAALMANGVPNSKYQAIKHVFKYVRPGMQRVTSSIDNALTRIGAYKDPKTGAETITMFNVSDFDAEVTLNLSNFADGTVFRAFASTLSAKWATLPNITAQSTLTFTLPKLSALTLYSGQDPTPVTGNGTAAQPPIFHIQDAVQSNPLRLASARGRLSEVQSLIASGADVNAADPITGWTALHAAAASPFPDAPAIMSALLAAGANALAVDFRGATTLHALTMNLWQEWQADYNALIVRNNGKADLLLNAGVDINTRDAQGRTPMHWAAMLPNMYSEYGHLNQTLQYLLNHGADRSAIDTFGKSAYDYATTEFRSSYADMLRWPTPYYDTRGPITRFAKYNLDKNQIDLTFTENAAASLVASDLVLRNIATNQIVTGWTLSTSFSFGITVAKVTLASRLPTGQYRLTLAAGAIADQNGIASNAATTVDFTSLAGDATGDGVVNFDDLLRLSQSTGRSGTTWSQGDFDGDGTVDFDDLLMLAQNYGLSAFVSPAVATARKSNTR